MKPILLCLSLLLIGFVSKAQSNVASLNITLTEIQSVTINNSASIEQFAGNKETSPNANLKVFNNSTSQVKQISSKNSEYEKLYKEMYTDQDISGLPSDSNFYSAALANAPQAKRPKTPYTSNLVIYQIDPR